MNKACLHGGKLTGLKQTSFSKQGMLVNICQISWWSGHVKQRFDLLEPGSWIVQWLGLIPIRAWHALSCRQTILDGQEWLLRTQVRYVTLCHPPPCFPPHFLLSTTHSPTIPGLFCCCCSFPPYCPPPPPTPFPPLPLEEHYFKTG